MSAARRLRVPVLLLVVVVAGFAVVLGSALRGAGGEGGRYALLGQPAPPLHGRTLEGDSFNLRSLRGSPVVVNVWASWCVPCRQELPLIRDVGRKWADEGVQVVTINTRDGTAPAREFLDKLHASRLRTVSDPKGRLAVGWGATGVPETYLVDARGIVRDRKIGPVTADWLRSHLTRLVDS